jgi:hypothetical protein
MEWRFQANKTESRCNYWKRRNGNYAEKSRLIYGDCPLTRAENSEHNGQTCYLGSLGYKKAYDKVPQKHLGKEHNYQNFYIFKETP